MGIDDRDYMRERQRARSGSTRWNDRAGRVEGAWFDPAIRSFDYQRGRWRGSRRSSPVRYIPFALSLLLILIPLYGEAQRAGWLPAREAAMPLPESGRSDERTVGKECVSTGRSRWSPHPEKKNDIQQKHDSNRQ